MIKKHCTSNDFEPFILYQVSDNEYLCPVCGSDALSEFPYSEIGEGSFEICECGFQFGYDDSPLASKEATEGIKANWKRWRQKVIHDAAQSSEGLEGLIRKLERVNIKLAYDLIDVDLDTAG
ncbi:MAG: hypothetical protein OCD00_16460 [Colwellia sp.]